MKIGTTTLEGSIALSRKAEHLDKYSLTQQFHSQWLLEEILVYVQQAAHKRILTATFRITSLEITQMSTYKKVSK